MIGNRQEVINWLDSEIPAKRVSAEAEIQERRLYTMLLHVELPFLPVKIIANIVGVSSTTIYIWIKKKSIVEGA